MRRLAFALIPFLAVAGCGHKAQQETRTTVTKDGVTTTTIVTRSGDAANAATTGSGLKIDTDDFKANLEIPGLSFTGDHMDMDGMKLYPGSRVKGMHIHAIDKGGREKGEVVMDFTSPAAPATVAQHMADQARKAGFTLAANTGNNVSGSKVEDGETNTFAVTLSPNGDATVGQMTMSGSKMKS